MKDTDKQIVLMNELLQEMAVLRCWIDGLQEGERSQSSSRDSFESLLNSFAKIRHLIDEVDHSLRLSS